MSGRRLAWTIWGASVAFAVAYALLDATTSDVAIGEYVFSGLAILLYATVGALITSRQPGNRVGLLFGWIGLSASASLLAGAYVTAASKHDLPLPGVAAWVAQVGFVAMFLPLAFLFLIFPTGRPASARWAWLARVMLIAAAINLLGFAVTPGVLNAGFNPLDSKVANPLGLPSSWHGLITAVTVAAGFVMFGGAVLSVVSLVQRYRRAGGDERQQIRLLAVLGAFLAVFGVIWFGVASSGVLDENGVATNVGFYIFIFAIFVGIPVTCAVAILRHGLWDLGVVVQRTVVFVILVAIFTAVGAAAAVFVSTPIVENLQDSPAPLLLFGAVMGSLIVPLYRVAKRIAERIVFKGRANPYEVLTEFSGRVGETYSVEDVLPRMAKILAEATRADTAHVWLRVGGQLTPAGGWPDDAPRREVLEIDGDRLPSMEQDVAFEVRDGNELLGALSVEPAPSDPMNASKERLVRDLAAQARLVLRNVRLIEELRASRQRLVAAQDEERRRLERNIHDGAQQQLVALQVKQRLVDSMIERDPSKAHELMEQLQHDTVTALDDLRDLARGIYPPLLVDQGLAAALGSQARKSPVPVQVEPDGIGRYPQDVEAAVYFSCLEALQNVAKYADATRATVRLTHAEGSITFEVTDDGRGFDPAAASRGSGLQGIADRLSALGGTFVLRSAPGDGTIVAGSIPAPEVGR